ncbi:signal recognition particle-docking protein FtsY [bacterium SM23_31]|nr:MAG: signal recognition particle-docking protein FtsY [bacterium SM23_31]
MVSILHNLKNGLKRTRDNFTSSLRTLIQSRKGFSQELLEEIEETLILGDIGVEISTAIVDGIREHFIKVKDVTYEQLVNVIKDEIKHQLSSMLPENNSKYPAKRDVSPMVILMVGVNGTGKTTAIGKLAYYYRNQGKRVLLAAADTYRAAAVDQLEIWKDRVGVDIIKNKEGTDPAAVAYDSAQAALARKINVLLIDTAGRIHTDVNLMQELVKIKKVIGKIIPGAPHKILLVIDANMGQNAISQARLFTESLDVSGIFLSKLDGTAKGGAVIPIMKNLKIPIEFVGTGELKEDLQLFNISEFTDALFA